MTRATGSFKWELDDIKFLFAVLEEVSDMLGHAGTQSLEILWVNPVRNVLGELLGEYRPSGGSADIDIYGFRNSFNLGWGEDSIHQRYAGWVDEWELGKLCQWSSDELHAHCLEKIESYKAIAAKLETRRWFAPADSSPIQETPSQAQFGNPSRGEGTQGSLSPGPISHLPVELLQQIFWLSGLPRHWVRAPLVLSHVNSHFRKIALNTPSLWASINDSLPSQILELYVVRSLNEPLDILTRPHYLYHKSPGWINSWFDFLTMNIARIQQVTVLSNSPRLVSAWGRDVNGHDGGITFTSLTKLAIRSISDTYSSSACPEWDGFPCLQELWIQGCWCTGWVGPEDPFPPTLQRLKLTRLSLVSLYTLLEALRGVPGLVSLVLEDFALDPYHGDPSPSEYQVTLPSLEELELKSVLGRDMNLISRHVSTQNLSFLSVTPADPSDPIMDFVAAFAATHPQIASLQILEFEFEPQELKRILQNLPNLIQLDIGFSNLTKDNLALLKEGRIGPLMLGFRV